MSGVQKETCPVNAEGVECNETQGLDILSDFRKIYEAKMQEINLKYGDLMTKEKFELQDRWIHDLRVQNEMLAEVISHLETETINKLWQLEGNMPNAAVPPLQDTIGPPLSVRKEKIAVECDLAKDDDRVVHEVRLTKELEEMYNTLASEILNRQGTTSSLRKTITDLKEKNLEHLKEITLKDDLIKELRRDLRNTHNKVNMSQGRLNTNNNQEEKLAGNGKKKASSTDSLRSSQSFDVSFPQSISSVEENVVSLVPSNEQESYFSASEKDMSLEYSLFSHLEAIFLLGSQNVNNFQQDARKKRHFHTGKDILCNDFKRLPDEKGDILHNHVKENFLNPNKIGDKNLHLSMMEKEDYKYLKNKVIMLEEHRDNIISNLRTAVDLYLNTIEILDASVRDLESKVDQHKMANKELRGIIDSLKNENEALGELYRSNVQEERWTNFLLQIKNEVSKNNENILEGQIYNYQALSEELMDLNYKLEVDFVNCFQDMSMLEAQLFKYRHLLKQTKEMKEKVDQELKSLSRKNKCYEAVVLFFKNEMGSMSEELQNLEEFNNNPITEPVEHLGQSIQFLNTIKQLRGINSRLMGYIYDAEKNIDSENEIRILNVAKINELQEVIKVKNKTLKMRSEVIDGMEKKLNENAIEKADLLKTIKNLTDGLVEIRKSLDISHDKKTRSNNIQDEIQEIKHGIIIKTEKIKKLEAEVEMKNIELEVRDEEIAKVHANYENLIHSLRYDLWIDMEKKITHNYEEVSKMIQEFTKNNDMIQEEISNYLSSIDDMQEEIAEIQLRYSDNNFYPLKFLYSGEELLTLRKRRELKIERERMEIEQLRVELEEAKLCSTKYQERIEEFKKSLIERDEKMEESEKICKLMVNLQEELSKSDRSYESVNKRLKDSEAILERVITEKTSLEEEHEKLVLFVKRLDETNMQLQEQKRYTTHKIQNLEFELSETRKEKETISYEARNLTMIVRLWLEEQRNINKRFIIPTEHNEKEKTKELVEFEDVLLFIDHLSNTEPKNDINQARITTINAETNTKQDDWFFKNIGGVEDNDSLQDDEEILTSQVDDVPSKWGWEMNVNNFLNFTRKQTENPIE